MTASRSRYSTSGVLAVMPAAAEMTDLKGRITQSLAFAIGNAAAAGNSEAIENLQGNAMALSPMERLSQSLDLDQSAPIDGRSTLAESKPADRTLVDVTSTDAQGLDQSDAIVHPPAVDELALAMDQPAPTANTAE